MKKYLKVCLSMIFIMITNLLFAGESNVTISSSASSNGAWTSSGGTYTFTPSANTANVNISELQNRLLGSGVTAGNVTILTSCASCSQSGNVTISGSITAALTTQKTFTITAAGTITVSSAVNISSTGGVAGGIISFSGATGITTNALITTSGSSPSTAGSGATGGAGGSITLTSSGGAVTVSAGLTSQGAAGGTAGTASGGAGGTISITGTSVTIGTAGSIQTQGGTGPGANGGAGGSVSVTSSSSTISITRAITTTGGNAGSANTGQRGGNAGAVTLTAYTTLSVSGTITATGGSNGGYYYQCGGSGATVTVRGTSITTGTINWNAGTSGGGASGCGSNGSTSTCTKGNVGSASSSPTVAKNAAMTSITHTTSLITAIGTTTGLPTGVSASYSSNTITISGTPTSAAGTYTYSLSPTTSSSCGIAAGSGTITVTAPLPVDLLYFDANKNKNKIQINWSTASEVNSDYYLLEKSYDGFNWFSINKMKAAGNSDAILTYGYIDEDNRLGINYYRLTQYDIDGTKHNYKTIYYNNSNQYQNEGFKIYPNPTNDFFNIEYYSEVEDEIQISVESEIGIKVYDNKFKVLRGNNFIQLALDNYANGMYHILIENNNGIYFTNKIIKE